MAPRYYGMLEAGYDGSIEAATGDDDSAGDDEASSGADAVDAIFGRSRRKKQRKHRAPRFVQEGGVQGPALALAGPASDTARFHCNGAKQIVDWMVLNALSAAGVEQWQIGQLWVGDYPQIKGGGFILGSAHAPAVQDRGVVLPAARDGWDIKWDHTILVAGPLNLGLSFHYVSLQV